MILCRLCSGVSCPSDSPLMTASKSQFSIPRLPQALAAAGLAAVLVGCGGGSSSERIGSPEGMPTLDQRKTTQRMKITDAIAAADSAVEKVNDDSSADDVSAAEEKIAAARTAITAGVDLDTDGYTTAVNVIEGELDGKKTSRTEYLADKGKERMAMERKERNAAVMPYATAINNWKVSSTLATLPKGTKALTTENKGGATMIKLLKTDNTEIPKTKVTAPPGLTAYKFTIENKKNYGTIFTTHGNPGTKTSNYTWDNLFGITGRSSDDSDGTTKNTNAKFKIATSASNGETITFSTTGTDARPYNLTKNDFSGIPLNSTAKAAGYSQTGEFLGVSGTFACENACTINDDDDGIVTVSGNVMTFTPDTGINLGNQSVTLSRTTKDTDYMNFGYWVTTGGTTAKPTKMIDTFAQAAGYGTNITGDSYFTDANHLRGKATYSGDAAGIYVFKTGQVDGSDLALYNGEFTAKANLTAQFGSMVKDGQSGYVDKGSQFKIHGTISNFNATGVSYGSMPDLSGWSLSLNSTDIGLRGTDGIPDYDSNTATPTPNAFPVSVSGTTTGGGKWKGQFYGGAGTGLKTGDSVPNGLTDTGDGGVGVEGEAPNQTLTANGAKFDDYPTAIVGEFNGHFSNGHVVGAFGAEKE